MPKSKALTEKINSAKSDSVSLILPYLYIGPYSATSAVSTSFVAGKGVTHVISIGRKPESTLEGVSYLRLSIEDNPSTPLSEAGGEAVAFIDNARAGKKSPKIFVHCSAGISRSPSIVAYYLIHRCDMSLKHALGLIIRARPQACPNPGFILQLREAELGLRGCHSLPPDMVSLPSKKEHRLALFQADQPDDACQKSSLPPPVVNEPCDNDKENAYVEPA